MNKVTAAQIKQWKAKYGEVFEITTPLDDKLKGGTIATGYFRKPDLKIISIASKYSEEPVKVGEIMYTNCWLGGDKELYDSNDEAKLSVMQTLGHLFKVRQSTIKKL